MGSPARGGRRPRLLVTTQAFAHELLPLVPLQGLCPRLLCCTPSSSLVGSWARALRAARQTVGDIEDLLSHRRFLRWLNSFSAAAAFFLGTRRIALLPSSGDPARVRGAWSAGDITTGARRGASWSARGRDTAEAGAGSLVRVLVRS